MFLPTTPVDATGALLWLAGIALAGFVVAYACTDLLRMPRTPYVAVLALVTAGLTAGYLAWSDSGRWFWSTRWAWGIAAAVLCGVLLTLLLRRLVPAAATRPRVTAVDLLWEGVVYGTAEGLLLSVLPVVVAWQALSALGWPGPVAGLLAVLASQAVIVLHHLGYRGYRGPRMRQPVIGCTVLSVAYMLTASPISAMGGHILLHGALLRRGLEMPPEHEPTAAKPTGRSFSVTAVPQS